MNTEETVYSLTNLKNTIEELQIDNIISCEVYASGITCHLEKLQEGVWTERFALDYPWEKSITYNNIKFFAIYTQKEYNQETA